MTMVPVFLHLAIELVLFQHRIPPWPHARPEITQPAIGLLTCEIHPIGLVILFHAEGGLCGEGLCTDLITELAVPGLRHVQRVEFGTGSHLAFTVIHLGRVRADRQVVVG